MISLYKIGRNSAIEQIDKIKFVRTDSYSKKIQKMEMILFGLRLFRKDRLMLAQALTDRDMKDRDVQAIR